MSQHRFTLSIQHVSKLHWRPLFAKGFCSQPSASSNNEIAWQQQALHDSLQLTTQVPKEDQLSFPPYHGQTPSQENPIAHANITDHGLNTFWAASRHAASTHQHHLIQPTAPSSSHAASTERVDAVPQEQAASFNADSSVPDHAVLASSFHDPLPTCTSLPACTLESFLEQQQGMHVQAKLRSVLEQGRHFLQGGAHAWLTLPSTDATDAPKSHSREQPKQAATCPPTPPSSLPQSPASFIAHSAVSSAAVPAAGQSRHFSDTVATKPIRFSVRIRNCESLNHLLFLWEASGTSMKASHLALLCSKAVELKQAGHYVMRQFDADRRTRMLLTAVAEKIQLGACTVVDLELLLSSWSQLATASSRSRSRWMPPPQVLHAAVNRLRSNMGESAPGHREALGTLSRLNASPSEDKLSKSAVQGHDPQLLSSQPSDRPLSIPQVHNSQQPQSLFTEPFSRTVTAPLLLSDPDPLEAIAVQHDQDEHGDKLKAASCSGLANISHSLRKLGQLDDGLLHQVAQLARKKAKHGSMQDLALLAHVLLTEGWKSREVYQRIAEAACPLMLGAPDPEQVTRLLNVLSRAGAMGPSFLHTVAEDVLARRELYAPFAPRIAHVCAVMDFDHQLLFEALAAMGLSRQGELTLGLWGQLLSAFGRFEKSCPDLCAAASRHASVSIQFLLLQQAEGKAIAKLLGVDATSKFHGVQKHLSHHAQVFLKLMATEYPPSARALTRDRYWDSYHMFKRGLDPNRQQLQGLPSVQASPELGQQPQGQLPLLRSAHQKSLEQQQGLERGLPFCTPSTELQQQRQDLSVPTLTCNGSSRRQRQHKSLFSASAEQQEQQSQASPPFPADNKLEGMPQGDQGTNEGHARVEGLLHKLWAKNARFHALARCRLLKLLDQQATLHKHAHEPQRQRAFQDFVLHEGTPDALTHSARIFAQLNLLQPGQRVEAVQAISGLLHGLGCLGYYDRELTSLACLALRSLCLHAWKLHDNPVKGGALRQSETLGSIVLAIGACARFRHYSKWLVHEAVKMLILISHSNDFSQEPSLLSKQHQQAWQVVQLLQALATLEGPRLHELLQDQILQSSPGNSSIASALDSDSAGDSHEAMPGMASGGRVRRSVSWRAKPIQRQQQDGEADVKAAGFSRQQQQQQQQEGEAQVGLLASPSSVVTSLLQLLARAQTGFTAGELCDMLAALAQLELCPWRELVRPALNRLAEEWQLKPRTITAPGSAPSSYMVGLVQNLIHGGYNPEQLEDRRKVQLYQMFLVAQAAGWQAEFKEAVGSWDMIRDARNAWQRAQPRMQGNVVQSLVATLEGLQPANPVLLDHKTKDNSLGVHLCCLNPSTGRLMAFQVLGPEQCTANRPNARALGPTLWLSRCLERRGVDCVTLTWFEYQMATDWIRTVDSMQRNGFVADTMDLPQFLGRLNMLLEEKMKQRLQMPPLPPLEV